MKAHQLIANPRSFTLGTLARDSALAQQHALSGHLRLHDGQPLRQGLATAYAVGQVIREGGSAKRFGGILSALFPRKNPAR